MKPCALSHSSTLLLAALLVFSPLAAHAQGAGAVVPGAGSILQQIQPGTPPAPSPRGAGAGGGRRRAGRAAAAAAAPPPPAPAPAAGGGGVEDRPRGGPHPAAERAVR